MRFAWNIVYVQENKMDGWAGLYPVAIEQTILRRIGGQTENRMTEKTPHYSISSLGIMEVPDSDSRNIEFLQQMSPAIITVSI